MSEGGLIKDLIPEIIVKKHAIERYRERSFNCNISNREIEKILQNIVSRGIVKCNRPGNAVEIESQGLSIVALVDGSSRIVLTFLGNRRFRDWAKKQEIAPRYKKYA